MTPWHQTAHTKLSNVLGPEKADRALERALKGAGLLHIDSVDDLLRFAEALSQEGGFTASVAALLSLHAVVNGAKSSASKSAFQHRATNGK